MRISPSLRISALTALMGGLLLGAPGSAGATPGPTVQFNAQVNAIAPPQPTGQVDNFPANKQNEPSIALDPTTGAFIAGSNDEIDEPQCKGPGSCPFVAGVGNSGVYRSTNGGSSWTQPAFTGQCGKTIRTLPGYCQLGLESFGDPTLAVGPRLSGGHFSFTNGSTVYYGNLAIPNNGNAVSPVIAVSRSYDDGASWVPPVVASSSNNPVDFNDKDYVWADANPKSPFFGNAYASWTLFQGNGKKGFTPEPIVFARSTDGGQTWSNVARLSASANNNVVSGRQGSLIRTGPDGTVYVFWEGSINHHQEILVAISHDGGVSFGRPQPVAPVSDIPSPLGGSSFRDNSFPSADINQVNGDLYVVWANEESSTALIKFTQSTDGGATWSAPITIGGQARAVNAFFPSVAASPDGTHVFVGWPAQTWKPTGTPAGPGVVSQFAAFNVRTNGAWSGGKLLSTASGDPDGSSANSLTTQFLGDYATAVSTNTTGYFVWTDTRNEAPCAAVDAFRSGMTPAPNPDLSCPPDTSGRLFGNSDIFVGAVGY